ncbi:NAD(P)H-dependent flavin oxidoreductase [Mycobacterium talmoniae]|uniref:2-nitropropane dioxygenase n=1 Tax=Mycobacterium talmoniae TaxID=1858794 RepID=A0A1S1NDA9_9MYCO|nr:MULTISPECIES: nitronate monooxygenase [Mycobacterium]OHV03610.1 2-nitropropane dioxygenase [Mycobacterium talmoniae]TDH47923.1 nitronate monooxygenase [Mycobacterium eburneum]
MNLLEALGLQYPVMQAGMGGVAGGELAGAVSAAGALGTVGIAAPHAFAAELRRAATLAPGRPVAANLLVPFIRKAHIDVCITAGVAAVVLHDGIPRRWIAALRSAGIPVLCTVGSAAQARQALAAGADGLVAQGVEAGGHLVAERPLAVTLTEVLQAADGVPVLAAGGVADGADVRRLLTAGAAGAVAGTRFLLTTESRAHPDYQRRVLDAQRTIRTLLFGLGWPLPHRVVPNAATDRWCGHSDLGPGLARGLSRVSGPLGRLLPLSARGDTVALQRVSLPLYTPALPLAGMPASVVDRSALYAGETMHRIHDVVAAAEAVARLAP